MLLRASTHTEPCLHCQVPQPIYLKSLPIIPFRLARCVSRNGSCYHMLIEPREFASTDDRRDENQQGLPDVGLIAPFMQDMVSMRAHV
jgi:hypothetical protein